MKYTEKRFRYELAVKLKKLTQEGEFFYYFIPDQPRYATSEQRFIPVKPFDLLVVDRGRAYGLELKSAVGISIMLSKFRDSQFTMMEGFERARGISFFLIHLAYGERKEKSYYNRAWLVHWSQVKGFDMPRQSIPVEWFVEHGREIFQERIDGKSSWNIDCLFEIGRFVKR